MRSESVKRAQEKYFKKLKQEGIKVSQTFYITCSTANDQDVIEVLNNQQNKSKYVKELIRRDQQEKGVNK